MEGSEAAMATASGMAAIMLMLFSLLKSGDHVVFSQSMFGSTIKLIGSEFARFGVESTVVPQTDLDAWRQAIRPNTRLLFAETPTNPLTDVCDIAALADHGAPRRLAGRGQLLCHSGAATSPCDGCRHRDAFGHQVPGRARPGDGGRPLRHRSDGARTLPAGHQERRHGALALQCLGRAQGLETLDIRMRAQSAQALELAQWLEQHPAVQRVYYPGCKATRSTTWPCAR
jgi:O-succinylhomoserine sulfhydrylase